MRRNRQQRFLRGAPEYGGSEEGRTASPGSPGNVTDGNDFSLQWTQRSGDPSQLKLRLRRCRRSRSISLAGSVRQSVGSDRTLYFKRQIRRRVKEKMKSTCLQILAVRLARRGSSAGSDPSHTEINSNTCSEFLSN